MRLSQGATLTRIGAGRPTTECTVPDGFTCFGHDASRRARSASVYFLYRHSEQKFVVCEDFFPNLRVSRRASLGSINAHPLATNYFPGFAQAKEAGKWVSTRPTARNIGEQMSAKYGNR